MGPHGPLGPRRRAGPEATPGAAAGTESEAWAVLATVHGLGPAGLVALVARHGSATAVLDAALRPRGPADIGSTPLQPGHRRTIGAEVAAGISAASRDRLAIAGRIHAAQVAILTLDDASYPDRLRGIETPPPVLFVAGDVAALSSQRAVAVVGTRRPTDAGRALATRIGAALAGRASVVSGLAIGIDGATHAAAIDAGGTTVAVLGSGHRRLYPAAHRRLAATILESGGAVVSELPPDAQPTRGTFPRRNRLISGLSDAVVVVEAGIGSGALITAGWAMEQGRGCFLVPGWPGATATAGSVAFLRDYPAAARIVAGVEELVEDLELRPAGEAWPAATAETALGTAERTVGAALLAGHSTLDELAGVSGLPAAAVLGTLTMLEIGGLVTAAYGRYRPTGRLATTLGVDGPLGVSAAALRETAVE